MVPLDFLVVNLGRAGFNPVLGESASLEEDEGESSPLPVTNPDLVRPS